MGICTDNKQPQMFEKETPTNSLISTILYNKTLMWNAASENNAKPERY